MQTKSLFIAVSFHKEASKHLYRLLIERFQDWDTPVYGNNLTHFFTRGPIDFPDTTRLNRAMRHPDLILILLSRDYLHDPWLQAEMNACLQLGRVNRDDRLVLLIPSGNLRIDEIPRWYHSHIDENIRLTDGNEKEMSSLACYIAKRRRERETSPVLHTSNKIFVVHGHDLPNTAEIEVYLLWAGLEPIVLHREPTRGIFTVLDKFRKHATAKYAIIILTADDIGYARKLGESHKELRARQNCLFEFGYFVSDLGPERICCVCQEDVILPSDITGLITKRFKDNVSEIKLELLRELEAAGYDVRRS